MPRKCRRQRQAQMAALRRHHSDNQQFIEKEEYDSTITMKMEMQKQEDDEIDGELEFRMNLDVASISEIFELCKRECGSRKVSVLIYMILRHLGHSWRQIDDILHSIGANQCKIAHKWAVTFLNGDFDEFEEDGRGGSISSAFLSSVK